MTDSLEAFYQQKEIDDQFNSMKLLSFLRQNSILEIECQEVSFPKNKYLIETDEKSEYIYFISDGIVAVEINNKIIDFKTTTDIVGFSELMNLDNSEFSYKSISKVVVAWKFKKVEVLDKLLNTQEGYLYHYHYLTKELHRLQAKEELLRQPSVEKIEKTLVYLIDKLGMDKKQGLVGDFIEFPISVALLAQYIELHEATIYRKIKEMRAASIIYTEKQKIYIDVKGLAYHKQRDMSVL
ncbi:Crp/Fnr family transcriptional regulator [Listeria booriae]|uniref:Crp/Fnr family transcriptional regulator n=1 Tax=Listeria booriae TaxID=1552123 RepID=A0A7X0XLZ9_9LIST|nr:Crp/Fnr family transcriptional regulator [Listeria booriae]MBC1212483.1 Crp/Fnr family transcriptional regulator [Listeria booriae]MBC1563506.1 Crp/Fnr family transcriptional regulator [Listeria booriae]MBC2168239.1 Crp/Fnr family transcriptional regulator [Listeria booriae]MBC2242383.1 Crp/Fnr family transcriptional regulator [Listeria booriae]MBC2245667.1 Crp/Fnr family transcriptional regulator [Listeria booriae]